MTRYRSSSIDALRREIEARESSKILVTMPNGQRSTYKVYVNGNIRRTPPRLEHLRAADREIIPVEPGEYRIVIRESEVHKEERAESNTLHFTLAHGEEVSFVLKAQDGVLVLDCESGT